MESGTQRNANAKEERSLVDLLNFTIVLQNIPG